MHAGRLGKICGLFRLCRLADSLAIALALGYAASAVAATETAVLDSPLMLTPPGAPQPNDPQLGGPQLGGPQLGDMQPAAGPWNDAASWSWQVLPGSLIYHSYLAGTKEPRFATQWFHDSHWGWTWDASWGPASACCATAATTVSIRTAGSSTWKGLPFRGSTWSTRRMSRRWISVSGSP